MCFFTCRVHGASGVVGFLAIDIPCLSLTNVTLDCLTHYTLSSTIFAHSYLTHVFRSFTCFLSFVRDPVCGVEWDGDGENVFRFTGLAFISAYFIPARTISNGFSGEKNYSFTWLW